MQAVIKQLTAEARSLDAMEESLVKEIIIEREVINRARLAQARLAHFRIAELQRQLDGLKKQQAAVESQLVEAQLEQVMKSGSVVFLKGTFGGAK